MSYCTQCAAEVDRLMDVIAQLQEIVNSDTAEEERIRAENERLRAYALKAFTVVEFCSGEGFLLDAPYYDCDDLLMEGVELLKVETPEEARAALEKETSE